MVDNYKIEKLSKEEIEIVINLSKDNLKFHDSCSNHKYLFSENVLEQYKNYLVSIIDSEYNFNLAIKLNNKIIGYVFSKLIFKKPYESYNKIAEIDDAFVIEKYRRNGYGEKLMKYLFDLLKEENVEAIYLLVDSQNVIGKNAWQKYGFKQYQEKLIKILI